MNDTIVVQYHNLRMLLTVDLNSLVETLLREFGPSVTIRLVEMTAQERATALEHRDGVDVVHDRFRVLVGEGPAGVRREDLERAIVERGQK